MATLQRHKKTAERYEQWLEENAKRKLKDRIEMFNRIADADYEELKNKIAKKEQILRVQKKRKSQVKKF